jgi:hypothetical protein
MKRLHFALVAVAALALCACSTTGPQTATATSSPSASPAATVASTAEMEKAVIDLEKKMWERGKNKQAEDYRKALAPGFRAVHADGIRDGDKDIQSMLADEIKEYSLSDFNVTFPNQDTAVMTYKGAMKGVSKGIESSSNFYASAVWARQNGEWKNVLYTQTKAEPPPKQ